MKSLRYIGPFALVDIPDAGAAGVAKGATFEASDEVAARLLEQVDNYQLAKAPKKRRTAKKAAAAPAPADPTEEV